MSLQFKLAFSSLLLGTAFICGAQQMPYSLAYTYTAITQTYDGSSVTSTSIANTYGMSGHTAAAATTIVSPSSRAAAANMYHDYQSSATTYLPICVGGDCEDGTYTAFGSGEEYCPFAFTFMAVASTQKSTAVAPFIEVTNVAVADATIKKQGGATTLTLSLHKSLGCGGGDVTGSLASPPSMQIELIPSTGVNIQSWLNSGASVSIAIKTSESNTVVGDVVGSGFVSATDCAVKGTAKMDGFKVVN